MEFQFSEDEMHDEDWKESYKNHFSPWSYQGIHFIPIWLKNEIYVPNNEKSLFLTREWHSVLEFMNLQECALNF